MSKTVKSILICPHTHTVTLIDRPQDLRGIYQALSHGDFKVDTIDAVRLENGDAIYIDDEGALYGGNPTWCMDYAPHLKLAGRGLLTGVDREGDDADPKTTLDEIKRHVLFLDMVTTGDFAPMTESTTPDGGFVIRTGDAILKDKDA